LKAQIIYLLTALLLLSCGSEDIPDIKVAEEVFTSHINSKPLPTQVNLRKDKTFLNRDYPIEIALYANGKWFYDLPNLGTGTGTYNYADGKLQLFAARDLFDINIELISSDQIGSAFILSFRDRFGRVVLETELMNKN
jgi:hypothetical protein